MADQAERLKELQAALESVDAVIARMLNERARLACDALEVMNAVGIITEPDHNSPVLSPALVAIAGEGLLGEEAMAHLFDQIRTQVRIPELRTVRANRMRQRQPSLTGKP